MNSTGTSSVNASGIYGLLTVVLITHDRPKFFKRTLSYWAEISCLFPILVIDSSLPETIAENQRLADSLSDRLRITFKAYDRIPVFEKILDALTHIRTPYVVLCADDDFLIPDGARACIEFLESHPGYSATHGRVLSVRPREHGMYAFDHRVKSIEAESPEARVHAHFSDFTPTLYSVHRTKLFQKNFSYLPDVFEWRFGELLLSILDVMQGKVKRLDEFYLVRQANPRGEAHKNKGWAPLIASPDFGRYQAAFERVLADELNNNAPVERSDAFAIISHGLDRHIDETRNRGKALPFPERVAQWWDSLWMTSLMEPQTPREKLSYMMRKSASGVNPKLKRAYRLIRTRIVECPSDDS